MRIIFVVETSDKFPNPKTFALAVKNKIHDMIDDYNFISVSDLCIKVSSEIIYPDRDLQQYMETLSDSTEIL